MEGRSLTQEQSAAEGLSPDEFVRMARRADLDVDAEYVRRISNVIAATEANYRSVRSLPMDGHEPATVFIPVKRPGEPA